jgi:hypothetical protein
METMKGLREKLGLHFVGIIKTAHKDILLNIADGVWSGKIVVNMSSSKLWQKTIFEP